MQDSGHDLLAHRMIAGIDLTDPGDLALLFICLPLELGVLAFLLFWMIPGLLQDLRELKALRAEQDAPK
jgi:hypothetical protein